MLNEKWLVALSLWKRGDPLPPRPRCNKYTMNSWDYWLVTGETCSECGWSSSEGSGCLI